MYKIYIDGRSLAEDYIRLEDATVAIYNTIKCNDLTDDEISKYEIYNPLSHTSYSYYDALDNVLWEEQQIKINGVWCDKFETTFDKEFCYSDLVHSFIWQFILKDKKRTFKYVKPSGRWDTKQIIVTEKDAGRRTIFHIPSNY